MSWWTRTRDALEATFVPFAESDSARKQTTGYTGMLNKAYSGVGGATNKILGRTNSSDKREQNQMTADQVQAYKDQTAITEKELQTTRDQQAVEKRRINEKQIRLLRNNYRSSGGGMMGNSSAPQSNTLGDQGSLPNKLGS